MSSFDRVSGVGTVVPPTSKKKSPPFRFRVNRKPRRKFCVHDDDKHFKVCCEGQKHPFRYFTVLEPPQISEKDWAADVRLFPARTPVCVTESAKYRHPMPSSGRLCCRPRRKIWKIGTREVCVGEQSNLSKPRDRRARARH